MFALTPRQEEAQAILAGGSSHILLYGGSRSGKTALIVLAIIIRALRAPRSRHAILRYRFNSCKTKVALDTFPQVMRLAFPQIEWKMNREDWFAILPNGSEVWFGGLDDKQRVEKILGGEYASIFLNECSEIPWYSRNVALTRLAQLAKQEDGQALKLRMYYDCNPPARSHWTYKLFVQKLDPETKRPVDANAYSALQMNPGDNKENVAAEYIKTLESLSPRLQRRFLYGEFAEAAAGQLFAEEDLDKWRVIDGKLPDFARMIIAVDPSGSGDTDNADNDAIGIVVVALGTDGNGYVLEDLTVKAGPATWGRIATDAYDRHAADLIVAETNFGGAMVGEVIRVARARTPFRALTASRGKVVRAEPIASLLEGGKLRLAGYFPELEEELAGFTSAGYMGEISPNRADAMVWGFSELFPGLVAKRDAKPVQMPQLVYEIRSDSGIDHNRQQGWLGA